MNTESFDAAAVGCSAVDYLGIVSRYPPPDVKMELGELKQQGGGLSATAMVTLARLGARACYIGKVGDDSLGQFIVRELGKEGVNTDYLVIDQGGSARFAFVVVDREKGTRTILWSRQGVHELKAKEVDRRAILSSRILLIDEYEPEGALAAARIAREAGIRVVLDAERVSSVSRELIELADVVIVSKDFGLEYTGKEDIQSAGRALFATHGGVVVLTAGVEGSFYRDASDEFFQPAFQVEVVDTTGAGDVFHGAFIYGLLREWSARDTTEFASAVAALKCRKLGGREGIPTLEEALGFLAERSGRVWVDRSRR